MHKDFKISGRDEANATPVVPRRHLTHPLNARHAKCVRALLAATLHAKGMTFREIRQVLNLSGPDVARGLVAAYRRSLTAKTP